MEQKPDSKKSVDLDRVVRLLGAAAGQMAEAYALLRQAGPEAEALRWDDAFSWQLEGLQKAIDTCSGIEQRLTSVRGRF